MSTDRQRATETALDTIARFYDLDLEGYEDDIALYRELAEEYAGPVLELGCGTGRVAAALAGAGAEVVGVDISAGMLAVARSRSQHVQWVEGDMRSLDLGRRFALVLVPLGGLQHMESIDDLVAALDAVARHLDEGGVAVVDVEAPGPEDGEAGPHPVVEHWTRGWGGGRVTKLVSAYGLPALGLREVTWHFDVQGAEGGLRRETAQFMMRTLTASELELAGRLAGLEVQALHGDYDGAPYDDGASRLIATFGHTPSLDGEGHR
ncbi:MAG: class I SAM-dependent methyltransferase [Dehalococcoidia bacterium]